MVVNIVMLVKDRPKLTEQSIQTLYRNTSKELYNLTLVDDESYKEYGQIYAASGSNTVVLRIDNSKGITGQARNLGVYWAEKYWGRGDWLYLSDNDVYFTPGWLERLVKTFEAYDEDGFKLFGGWNHPFLQPTYCGKNINFNIASHDAITGASQLMRWSTWDKYGPLDSHAIGVSMGEDWKFCQDIIKDGGRVGSIYPRVVFNCGITNSFGQPAAGQDLMMKELLEAKMKYRDLYWE